MSRDEKDNREIKEIIREIDRFKMLKDITPKIYADQGGYADKIAKNVKTIGNSQLRKFYGAIKRIERKETWEEIEPEFYLLKPKFAVSKGRDLIDKNFYNLVMKMMEKVDVGNEEEKMENFDTFVKFFEAIVAYFKFYNPKE